MFFRAKAKPVHDSLSDQFQHEISPTHQAKTRLILVITFLMICYFAVVMRLTDLTLL